MGEYKYESVYYSIKQSIVTSFKEGDQLPIDQYYADMYEVSLITIKKAMKILANEGYIERKSGMRTRVVSTNVEKKRYSLIIPDSSNAFGNEIANEFELWCLNNNYIPLISKSFENKEYEEEIIRNHIALKTCGLIIMPIYTEYFNADLIDIAKRRVPMVSIDRSIKYLPISTVKSNAKTDTKKLLQVFNLKATDCLLIISPPLDRQTPIYDRLKTLIEELELQNQEYKVIYTKSCINRLSVEEKITEQRLFKNAILATDFSVFDKVICLHYELACITDEIVKQMKFQVEIVCYDAPRQNINKFTHIKQNEKRILDTAIEILLNNENTDVTEIKINSDLVLENEK